MEFFTTLYTICGTEPLEEKFRLFRNLHDAFLKDSVDFDHGSFVGDVVPYSGRCRVVEPALVPFRKSPDTREGRAKLLHAIAHIEYCAVDLALDACYRFRHMPRSFYEDWMEVARQEIEHFHLIETLLRELDAPYGTYPVHDSLFEAARKTPDLLSRMAVVPRYLEASGLDHNPRLMKKFESMHDPMSRRILEALRVILREEIDHVRKGDRWFRYACEQKGVAEGIYFEIIEMILPVRRRPRTELNVEARIAAGFTCEELKRLAGGATA